jgi:hypothetical protein
VPFLLKEEAKESFLDTKIGAIFEFNETDPWWNLIEF